MVRYLVDVKYNRETDNPIYIFFDEETQTFDELVIPREDSFSYFLQTGMSIQEVRTIFESTDPEAIECIESLEYVVKFNLFKERWERVVKVNMLTAWDVKKHRFDTCHEGYIRRTTRHMLDKRWYMGMQYDSINQLNVPKIETRYITKLVNKGYPEDLVKQLLNMMFTPTPRISTMSFDIETETHGTIHPNPMYAATPIISAAFKFHDIHGNEEPGLVYILHNKLRQLDRLDPSKPLNELLTSGKVKMVVFETEYELINAILEKIKDPQYPMLLTYFGEGFDLPYLFNRAINLGINKFRIPYTAWRGIDRGYMAQGTPWRVKMKEKMHIDMQQFFAQPTVKNYVFKGKYSRLGLGDVGEALLGRTKIEYDGSINDMSIGELAYYNYIDADLTLELMKMGGFLSLRIIFMFMKLGRQGYYEAAHRAIGHKILNFIQGYLTERGILIPNRDDLSLVGTVHSKADIKGKGYKGAIVIDYVKGVHDKVQSLDFSSLYPSVMKSENLSFDTVNCSHPECEDNKVPELPHHVCTKKMGILPMLIGCIKDIRLTMFKPWRSDTSRTEEERATFKAVEQGIKVYVNACLPYGEEVITKDKDGIIRKEKIIDLFSSWREKKILSIRNDRDDDSFGSPIFTDILGIMDSGESEIIEIRLSDGRSIRCTDNHVFPKSLPKHTKRAGYHEAKQEFSIKEVEASELKKDDEIFVLNKTPLTEKSPDYLFIPDIIQGHDIGIGISRRDFKKHAYKRQQSGISDQLINLFSMKGTYSKTTKRYKLIWNELTEQERDIIREHYNRVQIKINPSGPGYWSDSYIDIIDDFIKLLGWYIAEGGIGTNSNRITITQYEDTSKENVDRIKQVLKHIGIKYSYLQHKQFNIYSKVYVALFKTLCGEGAYNKRIPIFILNKERAKILLDSYWRGDGNTTTNGSRRYSTVSKDLAYDILTLLGSIGRMASIQHDDIYRVVETTGRHYTRTYRGKVEFNGTVPVRIKSITRKRIESVIDIETGNGWFVTTNGIVVHNSYGVFAHQGFGLSCKPVAESITAFARDKTTRLVIEAERLRGTDLLEIARQYGYSKEEALKVLEFMEPVHRVTYGGDSVPRDTPVTIRRNEMVEIIPIEDLFYARKYGASKSRRKIKDIEIWTDDGWSEIVYAYRHKVKKYGYRILTDKSYVEVTEDHSLVINGKEVSPTSLNVGDYIEEYRPTLLEIIDVPYELAWTLGFYAADGTMGTYDTKSGIKRQWRLANQEESYLIRAQKALQSIGFQTTIIYASDGMKYLSAKDNFERFIQYFSICQSRDGDKIVPSIILNGTKETKQAFLEGYLSGDGHITKSGKISFGSIDFSLLSGLCLILENQNKDYTLYTYPNKPNFIKVEIRSNRPIKREPMKIISIEKFLIDDDVFDLETKRHCFTGGIGGVWLKNTDSGHFRGLTKEEQDYLVNFSEEELKVPLEPEEKTPIVLFYKKKNYIKVTEKGRVIVKGMLGKKRNTPNIAVRCFDEFKELLKKTALGEIRLEDVREKTIDTIRRYYDMIWHAEGEIEDYVFEVRMTKPISAYGHVTQHVKAAKKLAEHIRSQSTALRTVNDDAIVPAGSFIKYIKHAKGTPKRMKKGKRSSGVKCEPIPLEMATPKDISPIYYHDNLLSVMGQVMEALNIDEEEVITPDPNQPQLTEFME
ncbi:MAG: hypothetical protein GF411_03040 [Candidatus Lokiarchaeota archaeon]|nr:hypothetical protein [Candidatus Lokiarchaeota archaeon]